MKNEYTVVVEVYSFNERRAEMDLSALDEDGFEYMVVLIKNGCGCVIADFDSQEGLQPFQITRTREKAEEYAKSTQAEIEADINAGNIDNWFQHIQHCKCSS